MEQEYLFEAKDGYLLVRTTGDRENFKTIIYGISEIEKTAKKFAMKNILADYRNIVFKIPSTEAVNLVKFFELQMPGMKELSICMVLNSKNYDLGKHWEEICHQRGYNYRIFLGIKEGEHWISQQK